MKIEKSEHYTVEKDGVEFIRLGENNWIFLLGDTWEPIWDDDELENEFQEESKMLNTSRCCKNCRYSYPAMVQLTPDGFVTPPVMSFRCYRFPPKEPERMVCEGVDGCQTPIYKRVGGDPVVSPNYFCGEFKPKGRNLE